MQVRYRLIQFCVDPGRQEWRNVGVIVFSERAAMVRLVDEDLSVPDERILFRQFLPERMSESSWVYAEWIDRWTSVVRAFDGDESRFDAEIKRIEEVSGGQWSVTHGGDIDIPLDIPPQTRIEIGNEWAWRGYAQIPIHRAMNDLFDELVLGSEQMPPLRFLHAVERLLGFSEITYSDDFKRDETVAIAVAGQGESFVHFPYLMEGTRRIGFKMACFQGQRWGAAVSSVNDALFTFDMAVKSQFLTRQGCVVLSDTPTGHFEDLAAGFAMNAIRIDVNDPRASEVLYRLISEADNGID